MGIGRGRTTPCKIDATLHMQFQVSGWKSDMDKQMRWSGWKRPDGVNLRGGRRQRNCCRFEDKLRVAEGAASVPRFCTA